MFDAFIALLVSVGAVLGGGTPTAAPTGPANPYYANQTPYGDPSSSRTVSAPKGYELTFIETIGRHGARTLTSSSRERRSLKVWEDAKDDDALTDLGQTFADDVMAFTEAEQKIGYGNLSAIGVKEWKGIGRRTADNYRGFLEEATADGDSIVFKTSPVQRTIDSAEAMRTALAEAVPGLEVEPFVTDPATLLIGNGASIEGNRAYQGILARPEIVRAAEHLLGEMYDSDFVDALDDPVQVALDIYLLYCTAPGLADETDVTFAEYVPIEDARVLAYASDARIFYQYGPGVAGQDNSFRAARPLLDDFFAALDDRLAGGDTAAVFRLAHGETTMPFEALTDMPGSQEQAPITSPFTYESNPWRGEVAGRLAGNVEWTAFTSRSGKALVSVRYNEEPVKLAKECRATRPYFYRPAELKRCLD